MDASSLALADVPVHCAHHAMVPLSDLKPNLANPHKHPEKQLAVYAEVLKAHGWRKSITVSHRSGLIVRGHGALMAARRLGLAAAPVEYQEYATEAAELEDLIADNRLPELASTDKGKLTALIEQITGAGVQNPVTGYSPEDLAKLLEEVAPEPLYPITARLNERHDYVLILADNETDFQFLKNLCGVREERSYKNSTTGEGRVVPMSRFLQSLRENCHTLTQAGVHHDDAPAAQ